jgi:hypothetical protein
LAQILATLQNSTPIIVSTEPEVKTQTIQAPPVPAAAADSVEFDGKVYTREGNAKFWIVLDHLRTNPGDAELSFRKLAEQVGVSKTLAEQAKKKA